MYLYLCLENLPMQTAWQMWLLSIPWTTLFDSGRTKPPFFLLAHLLLLFVGCASLLTSLLPQNNALLLQVSGTPLASMNTHHVDVPECMKRYPALVRTQVELSSIKVSYLTNMPALLTSPPT